MDQDIHYTDSLEQLLKENAEHFLSLRWCHDAAQRYTSKWAKRLTIPTIILSGLAGLGSVGSDNLLPFAHAETLIGLVSFTCATLQTIQSFLGFSRRSENHRISALSYEKLHRLISIQLSIPRSERIKPLELLQQIQQETDRLAETSEQLPSVIISLFKDKFKTPKIAIPAILNGLHEVRVVKEDGKITSPLTPGVTPRPPIKITVV